MNPRLKQLLKRRSYFEKIEEQNYYHEVAMEHDLKTYLKAKTLREKTEKEIFKILEDDTDR